MDLLDTAIPLKLKERLTAFRPYQPLFNYQEPPSAETIQQQNEDIKQQLTTKWADLFTPEQRALIRKGLYQDLNVAQYANPTYSIHMMRVIHHHLERHKNLKTYQEFSNLKGVFKSKEALI